MNRKQLKKNVLDLKYQFESQKINAVLIICTVGILTFLGTFIWYRERLFFGLGFSVIIIVISIFFYIKTRRKMRQILSDLENIK